VCAVGLGFDVGGGACVAHDWPTCIAHDLQSSEMGLHHFESRPMAKNPGVILGVANLGWGFFWVDAVACCQNKMLASKDTKNFFTILRKTETVFYDGSTQGFSLRRRAVREREGFIPNGLH